MSFTSLSAHAAALTGQGTWENTLQGRDLDGDATTFEAWYDTTLNITWLANADAGKAMTWSDANAWAADLDVHGITGWRLPTVRAVDGRTFNMTVSTDATTDHGYAGSAGWRDDSGEPVSEMGHMFYVTLGNRGYCPPDGGDGNPETCDNAAPAGWGLSNTGPFSNLQGHIYWSGTPVDSNGAWGFSFQFGAQDFGKKDSKLLVWVVQDGDVADRSTAPVPSSGSD